MNVNVESLIEKEINMNRRLDEAESPQESIWASVWESDFQKSTELQLLTENNIPDLARLLAREGVTWGIRSQSKTICPKCNPEQLEIPKQKMKRYLKLIDKLSKQKTKGDKNV